MLAVGRALMSRPRLILLDEPSMGLAPVMVLRLFDLIQRVRAEGYTILVVEQNVRQVLKIVDRAYLLEVGRIRTEGTGGGARPGRLRAKGVRGPVIDPIFLLEAAINGILLGGILALLALGLNLIFGVIDIVWIVYVDLVMLCMYVLVLHEPGLRLAVLGGRAGGARGRRRARAWRCTCWSSRRS